MAYIDKQVFKEWYDEEMRSLGHTGQSGEVVKRATRCSSCLGEIGDEVPAGDECLGCLAERFGMWSCETQYADTIATLIRTAVQDPNEFRWLLGQIVFEVLDAPKRAGVS